MRRRTVFHDSPSSRAAFKEKYGVEPRDHGDVPGPAFSHMTISAILKRRSRKGRISFRKSAHLKGVSRRHLGSFVKTERVKALKRRMNKSLLGKEKAPKGAEPQSSGSRKVKEDPDKEKPKKKKVFKLFRKSAKKLPSGQEDASLPGGATAITRAPPTGADDAEKKEAAGISNVHEGELQEGTVVPVRAARAAHSSNVSMENAPPQEPTLEPQPSCPVEVHEGDADPVETVSLSFNVRGATESPDEQSVVKEASMEDLVEQSVAEASVENPVGQGADKAATEEEGPVEQGVEQATEGEGAGAPAEQSVEEVTTEEGEGDPVEQSVENATTEDLAEPNVAEASLESPIGQGADKAAMEEEEQGAAGDQEEGPEQEAQPSGPSLDGQVTSKEEEQEAQPSGSSDTADKENGNGEVDDAGQVDAANAARPGPGRLNLDRWESQERRATIRPTMRLQHQESSSDQDMAKPTMKLRHVEKEEDDIELQDKTMQLKELDKAESFKGEKPNLDHLDPIDPLVQAFNKQRTMSRKKSGKGMNVMGQWVNMNGKWLRIAMVMEERGEL